MSHPLRALGRTALRGLAEALATGRVAPPFHRGAVASYVPEAQQAAVADALGAFERDGMAPRHIAYALQLLLEERDASQRMSDRIELVLSPPELDTVDARDTAVVVQELFRRVRSTVLISTFALDEKRKAETIFGGLAVRMDADPDLRVRVFANIHRAYEDQTPSQNLIRDFRRRVASQIWPGKRVPEVFYDPRSLELDGQKRAVLHAKVVIVDGRYTLLTSANFTEAAQERNIEAGVVLDDRAIATRMTRQFDRLVEARVLRPLFGLPAPATP